MANLNKVLLIGNLTRDPELRYTPQGTAVATLRMAINRKYKDRNQELKEEVCFINVIAWDKQAENCNQYLQKGRPVFIEGRLQSRNWEDKSGQRRTTIEVRAERIQFLGGQQQQRSQQTQETLPEEQVSTTESTWLEESEGKADGTHGN